MKKYQHSIWVTITAIIFNVLFWKESLAINLCLFNILLLSSLLYMYRPKLTKGLILNFSVILVSAIGIVIHGSALAVFTQVLAITSAIGMIHRPDMYNALLSSFSWINNIFVRQKKAVVLKGEKQPFNWVGKVWFYLKIVTLPLVVIWVFYLLYKGANPIFDQYSDGVMQELKVLWVKIFKDISIGRVLFFFAGFFICSGALIYKERNKIYRYYTSLQTSLTRKKYHHNGSMISLKLELKAALFLLVGINALLFIVNAIDISWVWFGFTVPENFDLKQFVHQGTYLLITSILLAMGILFYFFRGNLNFLKTNQRLKQLSYVWIIQNSVLVFSVFLRNLHYIKFHGLAYGRIGVIVFLTVTICGLIALFIKIRDRKSSYFTFHYTSTACAVIFGVISFVNWDRVICEYNLSFGNSANIDPAFYLRLSPSVYPILFDNMHIVHQQIESHAKLTKPWYAIKSTEIFDARLSVKAQKFVQNRKDKSWLSWSYAKQKSLNFLNGKNLMAKNP